MKMLRFFHCIRRKMEEKLKKNLNKMYLDVDKM